MDMARIFEPSSALFVLIWNTASEKTSSIIGEGCSFYNPIKFSISPSLRLSMMLLTVIVMMEVSEANFGFSLAHTSAPSLRVEISLSSSSSLEGLSSISRMDGLSWKSIVFWISGDPTL